MKTLKGISRKSIIDIKRLSILLKDSKLKGLKANISAKLVVEGVSKEGKNVFLNHTITKVKTIETIANYYKANKLAEGCTITTLVDGFTPTTDIFDPIVSLNDIAVTKPRRIKKVTDNTD